MERDVGSMIAVGIVWGATNAWMRQGAKIWDENLRSKKGFDQKISRNPRLHRQILGQLKKWLDLVLVWQYSVPFLLNLSASASFFYVLSSSPISVAVPVTNAVTFAATAVFASFFGEELRVWHFLLGTSLIVLGICLCIS
ncbi:uncharacterized protein LOC144701468 [Wolffia australiana]